MKKTLLIGAVVVLVGCSGGGGSSGRPPVVTESPSGALVERDRLLRWDLAVADLDLDGLPEVVIAETILDGAPPHSGYVTVIRQTAPRQFSRGVTYATPPEAHSVGIADMDADGFPDVLVGSHVSDPRVSADRLTLFRHSGSGVRLTTAEPIDVPILLEDFAIADLNGDGLPDVVAAGAPHTLVLLNDPERPGELLTGQMIDQTASSLALGDLDGDGNLDLVLNRGSVAATLRVYLQEDGWFVLWGELSTTEARDTGAADMDGDGRLDIVVTSGVVPGSAPWPNVGLFRQAPDSGARLAFEPSATYLADESASHWVNPLGVADFDGDGRLDVAMVASHANRQRRNGIYNYVELRSNVAVLQQSGTGTFARTALHLIPEGVWDLSASDVDGDAHPDIVLSSSRTITMLYNDDRAPGTFGAPTPIAE